MKFTTQLRVLFSLPVLLALLTASAHAAPGVEKARANLVRFNPAEPEALPPDTDARGRLMIETKASTGRSQLTVLVKGVDKNQTYDLYMEDPQDIGGPLVQVGTFQTSGNIQKLKIDTGKGDPLPFGEANFDNLIGLGVEVRVGSAVYLSTVVPAFGASKKKLGAKQDLGLALKAPDSNAVGTFHFVSKGTTDDQRIRVKVKAIDFNSHDFFLFVETEVDSGVFENGGILERKSPNHGEFNVRTKDGAALPFGELSAADFAGRKIEIRDQNDIAYLAGLVPQMD